MDPNCNYIYLHQNIINGKCYIGQTNNTNERWYNKGKGYAHCPKFYNAIKKYGWDNFTHIILKKVPADQADFWERFFIKVFDSVDNGYNLDSGGCKNKKLSKETVDKWNKLMEKHRKYNKNYGMRNKKHSQETKDKLSKISKGKHYSKNTEWKKGQIAWNKGVACKESTKKKLRKCNLGKKYSEETKRKHSRAMKGHIVSLETRKKISDKLKGHKVNQISLDKMRKKVICIETGIIYNSLTEASEKNNYGISNISFCCSHPNKTYKNFHWRYVV